MSSGIYKILNIANCKIYIGSAKNFYKRWNLHRSDLINNKHPNRYLQFAWNKQGEWFFKFEIIEIVDDPIKLIEREQYWIDLLAPEYNICKIAGSNLGIKYSEESKKKMSAWQIGRKMSDEARARMSVSAKGHIRNRGRIISEEGRLNMSLAHKGKKPSEETKIKLSLAKIGNKSHTGRQFSEEHKRNLSISKKGKKRVIVNYILIEGAIL